MESVVMGLMNLVGGAFHWGIDNALALAVGALLGSELAGAALGAVSDLLGRARGLLDGVASRMTKK